MTDLRCIEIGEYLPTEFGRQGQVHSSFKKGILVSAIRAGVIEDATLKPTEDSRVYRVYVSREFYTRFQALKLKIESVWELFSEDDALCVITRKSAFEQGLFENIAEVFDLIPLSEMEWKTWILDVLIPKFGEIGVDLSMGLVTES